MDPYMTICDPVTIHKINNDEYLWYIEEVCTTFYLKNGTLRTYEYDEADEIDIAIPDDDLYEKDAKATERICIDPNTPLGITYAEEFTELKEKYKIST